MILNAILLLSATPTLTATECNPPAKLGSKATTVSKNLRTMFEDKKGVYWFGSDSEGLFRYDKKNLTRFTKNDGLVSDQIIDIQQDKAGNHYFVTYAGVSKFDGKTFTTLKPVIMDAPDKGWKLHPDDLWFKFGSKDGGPSRYDGKTLYCLRFPRHYLDDPNAAVKPLFSMYDIYTIYKDNAGNIWFGTAFAGLCRYDGKTINWLYESHLTAVPNAGSFGIRSIIEDRDGKLWVCNTKYRFEISPTNLPSHGLIEYKSAKGTGSLKSLIGVDDLYYQSVVKGKEGDLWLMPWSGGIYRYDGKKITHYPVKDGDKDALMSQIYKDRHGVLWICSQTGGPYKFNGKSFEKFVP